MNYVNDVAEVEDSTSEIKVVKDDWKTEEKENEPGNTHSCKKNMVGEERESETPSRPPSFENVRIETHKVSQDVDDANSAWITSKPRSTTLQCGTFFGRKNNLRKNGMGKGGRQGVINESLMTKVNLFQLKSLWGNYNFDFACSTAMGHSGGMVSMWDTTVFVKSHIHYGVNYVIVAGKWMGVQGVCHVINVYAPQSVETRKRLWEEIRHYMRGGCSTDSLVKRASGY
ncbi:RNA-directed DNA polymerase, eukaryota [Artemisia annua]|uniref:RNA-directed DNA polymerase, eukaryota n=1 Tax=Artemisia annua TaxID=35608 RepID=A0A2U1N481_ARTAN|nr:RNA-directed DNA polymerase, eukaryota [Artemisia annua]